MLRLEFHTNETILFLALLFFILIKIYFNKSNLFLDSVHKHWIQGFVLDNQTVYQQRYMPVPYPSGFCLYKYKFLEKILSFEKVCSKEYNDFPCVLSHAVNMDPFTFQ